VRGDDEREWEEIHILCARAVNARFAFLETTLPRLPREKPRVVWYVSAHALMHGEEKHGAARLEHAFTAYRTVLQKVSYCSIVSYER
jgi:hypothetical protein